PKSKYPLKGLVQKQATGRRSISNNTTLTLTLSRLTGEGTARPAFRSFRCGWMRPPTEHDSPSPIRWEHLFSEVGTPRCGVPAPFRRGTRVGCKPFRPLHAGGDIAARCPYPQQDPKHVAMGEGRGEGQCISKSEVVFASVPTLRCGFWSSDFV